MFGISTAGESPCRVLKLVAVGVSLPWFNPIPLMNNNRCVFGVNLGDSVARDGQDSQLVRSVDPRCPGGLGSTARGSHVPAGAGRGGAGLYGRRRRNTGKVVLTV